MRKVIKWIEIDFIFQQINFIFESLEIWMAGFFFFSSLYRVFHKLFSLSLSITIAHDVLKHSVNTFHSPPFEMKKERAFIVFFFFFFSSDSRFNHALSRSLSLSSNAIFPSKYLCIYLFISNIFDFDLAITAVIDQSQIPKTKHKY